MVAHYLSELELPERARVVEIGCGTGGDFADHRRPSGCRGGGRGRSSAVLVAKARELAATVPNAAFEVADGGQLPIDAETFDAAVLYPVLSHPPRPERVLAEAFRGLRPGGRLALFDGDYATITVAIGVDDPPKICVSAFAPASSTIRGLCVGFCNWSQPLGLSMLGGAPTATRRSPNPITCGAS